MEALKKYRMYVLDDFFRIKWHKIQNYQKSQRPSRINEENVCL